MTTVDFDAAWAEQEDAPFTWRVHGDVEVTMPGARPAGLVLHLHRIREQRGPDAQLSLTELRVAARLLFGGDVLATLLKDRFFSEEKLSAAVMGVLTEYREREARAGEPADAGGKSPAPSGGSAT